MKASILPSAPLAMRTRLEEEGEKEMDTEKVDEEKDEEEDEEEEEVDEETPESVEAVLGTVECEHGSPGVRLGYPAVPLQHYHLALDSCSWW